MVNLDFKYKNAFELKDYQCVFNAIGIATGMSYDQIFEGVFNKKSKLVQTDFHHLLLSLGFEWNFICVISKYPEWKKSDFYLNNEIFKNGTFIVMLNNHLTCIIDGCIYDTYDPRIFTERNLKDNVEFSKNGERLVYGYYKKK